MNGFMWGNGAEELNDLLICMNTDLNKRWRTTRKDQNEEGRLQRMEGVNNFV